MDQTKEMPREVSHEQLLTDQEYVSEILRIARDEQIAKGYDVILGLAEHFVKTAKRAKVVLDQKDHRSIEKYHDDIEEEKEAKAKKIEEAKNGKANTTVKSDNEKSSQNEEQQGAQTAEQKKEQQQEANKAIRKPFTRDIAYNAQVRANQWAAGFDDEASPTKKAQIAALTEEQQAELDTLHAFFGIMEEIYAEKIRRQNITQAGKDAQAFVANETKLVLAQNDFKRATENLKTALKERQPLDEVLELLVAQLKRSKSYVEVAKSNKVAAEADLEFTEIKLRQHINKLDTKRNELTAENKEELARLEKEKELLINIMNLGELHKEVYLIAPMERITDALFEGKYGDIQTPYAQRAKNYISMLKDSAAFVKYELKQDMKKLKDIEDAIRAINDSLNDMLADFDKEHKTNLCKDKLSYDEAVEMLTKRQSELDRAIIAVTETEDSMKAAERDVKAAIANEEAKYKALDDAKTALKESYAAYRQSAVDAKEFANAMLRDHVIEQKATAGVPKAAEEIFGALNVLEAEEEPKNESIKPLDESTTRKIDDDLSM